MIPRAFHVLLPLVLGLLVGAPLASAEDEKAPTAGRPMTILEELDRAVGDAVARARPSVAQVAVWRSIEIEGAPIHKDQVFTSGVVLGADGYVLSLGRAFETADAIEVTFASGEMRRADLVGTDDDTGLALLKVSADGLKEPLRSACLGSSKALRPGSIVIAISNPFGLAGSAALGSVAGVDRVVKRGRLALTGVLQITTPVNPGDPGGILADCRGDVVGIIASTYERPLLENEAVSKIYKDLVKFGEGLFGKTPPEDLRRLMRSDEARYAGGAGVFGGHGIGFAIPIDQAREVAARIKARPLGERPYLGIQVVAAAELTGQPGVAVVGVREGSPAEKAGLRQHDIVVRFGGKDVANPQDFKRLVLEGPVGREVELEIRRHAAEGIRRGEEPLLKLKVVLEPRGKKQ